MSEIITPDKPEETTEEKQELSLPRVENPLLHFDKEKKMFWIGIPVDKVRPFEGTLLLDMVKMEYFKAFTTLAVEVTSKIQKASPGFLNKMRAGFLKSTGKA